MAKQINNNLMATMFFSIFVLMFLIFAYTRLTMNIIIAIVCLIFAVGFKSWHITRETNEVIMFELEELGRVCRQLRRENNQRSKEAEEHK